MPRTGNTAPPFIRCATVFSFHDSSYNASVRGASPRITYPSRTCSAFPGDTIRKPNTATPASATAMVGRTLRVRRPTPTTNHTPNAKNITSITHDSTQFIIPNPPCSAKSNKTGQSKTVDEHPDSANPANARPIRRLSRTPHNANPMNANHTQPTIHPNSAKSVICALIIVRISGMPSSRNAEATAPELPSPTPSGFAAKSRNPASQIFGRFRIDPSRDILGAIHQAAARAISPTNASTFRERGCLVPASPDIPLIHHHATASTPATNIPVRDCVAASAITNTALNAQPIHLARHQPQHSGNNTQTAAAA